MPIRRSAAFLARWAHTFVSVAGFGALIFFSFTGITLNHAETFETAEPVEAEFEGAIPSEWCSPGEDDVKRLEIVEELRSRASLRGRVVEFRVDEAGLSVLFEAAGFTAHAYIDRATGEYEGLAFQQGIWVLINDLHKGRGTGEAWSWLIDISAAVLLVCGLTGLWLLWYVKRRRVSGLIVTTTGMAIPLLIYVLFELSA